MRDCINLVAVLWAWLILQLVCRPTSADYGCVCNYKVESPVYKSPDSSSGTIGYLYEFDCKPTSGDLAGGFYPIQYSHMTGYLASDSQVTQQICPGDLPEADRLTTIAGAPATSTATTQRTTTTTSRRSTSTSTEKVTTSTAKPFTTTTLRPTTTTKATTTKATTTRATTTKATTTRATTTRATTTKATTTRATTTKVTTRPSTSATNPVITQKPPKVPEGHIELCPNVSKNDVERNGGFLGQYGEYCYEFVPYQTQWKNAERHCGLVSSGHLAHIANQDEQDYIMRFLQTHNRTDLAWIGLSDSNNEGVLEWSSGMNVTFQKLETGFTSHTDKDHKLNDCFVMDSTGGWVDRPCGVVLILGAGLGEAHTYVCQYNLTSEPPGIFEGFLPGFVVG